MRLRRIRIEQFRRFAAPIEIAGLEAGLNILHGPNEAGKSTIAQALRTLFFERHNTRGEFVQAVSPAGAVDAAPSIEAEFLLGTDECKAAKTFFQKPRAHLSIDGRHWDGGDADEQLAERLGFALSGRGSSRADTHGIPGLLWIEQGGSADLATPVIHAAGSLEERLKGILGDLASTSGSQLAPALHEELRTLRTATGRSTGVLAAAEQALETACAERDALQAAAEQYRGLADTLARKLVEQERLEADKPWLAYESRRRDAEDLQAQLEPEQRALEANRQGLREIQARIDSLHDQHAAREKDLGALARQRDALATAAETHQQAVEALRSAEQRRSAAREALRVARIQHQAAEQRRQHDALQAELTRIRADIARIEAVLERAAQFGGSIAALRQQAAATKVSRSDLGKLEKLDRALRENRIQRDAVATRIAYRLDAGQHIDAGSLGILHGSGDQQVTAPVTLCIAGIGEIDIAPGGEDVARLSEEAGTLAAEFAALCAKAGVSDLADAQMRHARWQELEHTRELQEKERDTLLGDQGEAAWRERLAEARGHCSDREQRLQAVPIVAAGLPIEEARHLYEDAESAGTAAEEELEERQKAAAAAELAYGSLQSAVEAETRRLDSEEARTAAGQRSRELAEALARRDALERVVTDAAATLAGRNPELIAADIQRLTLALAAVENERRDLRDSIREIRGKLSAYGADGLDEQLAAATIAVGNLERQLAHHRLRADALSLLTTRLSAHQEAATQRLYEPLRARLAHYLAILFPRTRLDVGIDNLRPTVLGRDGAELPLESHSHGTREQLGVIARFAYADLLKEAGQPTLLILDDALVHSDAGRRAQMKRILHDAAQRHQILLFTCHPEEWRDAGARTMIDVGGC
jgi:energy-coupling factor transporter ATP-binding protein EcfA2